MAYKSFDEEKNRKNTLLISEADVVDVTLRDLLVDSI
jgi:hypothetical protein